MKQQDLLDSLSVRWVNLSRDHVLEIKYPSPTSTMAKPIDHARTDCRFVYVSETRGGTFEFAQPPPKAKNSLIHFVEDGIKCMGTMWCATCVVIYIQTSISGCFFAHINGFSAKGRGLNKVTEEEGEMMGKAVYEKLKTEMKEKEWDVLDGNLGKSVVLLSVDVHVARDGVGVVGGLDLEEVRRLDLNDEAHVRRDTLSLTLSDARIKRVKSTEPS